MKVEKKHPNQELLHSCCHFFTSDKKNDHNLAILASINLYYMSFYSSRASDSDGIETYHVRQNGRQLQLLHAHDTDTSQDANFITRRQLHRFVSSEFLYTQERFLYQKKAYFINVIFMYSTHSSAHV